MDTRLFHILIAIFCALGTFELMRALGDRAACMPYVMIYGVGVIPAYVLGGVAAAAVVFGLFAVSFCLLCLLDRTMKAKQLFLTLFAMVYPSFFLVAMAAVNDMGGNGYFALLLIFLVSPAADTFAYLVGSLLKGPKLCPKLSPNKTISGAIGGLVGGVAAAIAIYYILRPELNVPFPPFFSAMIGCSPRSSRRREICSRAISSGNWASRIWERSCRGTAEFWTASTGCCLPAPFSASYSRCCNLEFSRLFL